MGNENTTNFIASVFFAIEGFPGIKVLSGKAQA